MFKGKAVLIMTRAEASNPKEFQWDIDARVMSLNHDDPGGEVDEAFSIMKYDYFPAPRAAYNIGIGDTLRVLVHFEIHFTKGDGWTTDDDMDLYLEREYVLARQPFNARRFRRRFYKYWKDQQ